MADNSCRSEVQGQKAGSRAPRTDRGRSDQSFCFSYLIFIKAAPCRLGHSTGMKRLVRIFSCLCLSLALVLSGPGGPGPAKGATMLVICGDSGAELVWLDADGTPVEPGELGHSCPDCIVLDGVMPVSGMGAAMTFRLAPEPRVAVQARLAPAPAAHLRPDTRGPPAAQATCLRLWESRITQRSPTPDAALVIDFYQSICAMMETDLRTTSRGRP